MSCRTAARIALVACLSLLAWIPAHAQLFRAYLSIEGSDANPCTVAAPCRLLPAALAAVAAGGEVWMLDSANYNTGTVNIDKSVTILAVPGAVGSLVAASANAINVATAGVNVTLRNLVIVPLTGATGTFSGIEMTAGASLVVDRCVIANMSNIGIFVRTPARVRIVDSTVRGNAGTGIWVEALTASSTTLVDIAGVTVDGNFNQGLVASSGNATAAIKITLKDSRVVQTNGSGVVVQSLVGGAVTLSASNNLISNNGSAGLLGFGAGTKVWASGNTVSGNGNGFMSSGALFESANDNAVRNNTNNVTGTITPVGPT